MFREDPEIYVPVHIISVSEAGKKEFPFSGGRIRLLRRRSFGPRKMLTSSFLIAYLCLMFSFCFRLNCDRVIILNILVASHFNIVWEIFEGFHFRDGKLLYVWYGGFFYQPKVLIRQKSLLTQFFWIWDKLFYDYRGPVNKTGHFSHTNPDLWVVENCYKVQIFQKLLKWIKVSHE